MAEIESINEAVVIELKRLLDQVPLPIHELHKIGLENQGFQTRHLRKRIWPKLLNINRFEVQKEWENCQRPSNEIQSLVKLDVSRSLHVHEAMDAARHGPRTRQQRRRSVKVWQLKRDTLQKIIENVIGRTDGRDNKLHYYQGFHDVVSIILLVFGCEIDIVSTMIDKMASKYLIDFMKENFDPIVNCIEIIFPLIQIFDNEVYEALISSGVAPHVTLSWCITWFSHDVQDSIVIERLFDIFLCSHPSFPLYVAAATIIASKDKVLACESDFSEMHTCLINLTRNNAQQKNDHDNDDNDYLFTLKNIELKLLPLAIKMFHKVPYDKLLNLNNINQKTILYFNHSKQINSLPNMLLYPSKSTPNQYIQYDTGFLSSFLSKKNNKENDEEEEEIKLSDFEQLEAYRLYQNKNKKLSKSLRFLKKKAKIAQQNKLKSNNFKNKAIFFFKRSSFLVIPSIAVMMVSTFALMFSQQRQYFVDLFFSSLFIKS